MSSTNSICRSAMYRSDRLGRGSARLVREPEQPGGRDGYQLGLVIGARSTYFVPSANSAPIWHATSTGKPSLARTAGAGQGDEPVRRQDPREITEL